MIYKKPTLFFDPSCRIPIIDVRSPLEFQKGHIPGALNIPLFSNNERHEIGIIYKKLGKQHAIEKGLGIVGPKMMKLGHQAQAVSESKERKVYCWRGGMRSEKMAWLFELLGMECEVLEGGYKSYRNMQIEDLSQIKDLIVLHGSTGCGKTAILAELNKQGEQIIDLEKIANHRGSAFGYIGTDKKQPTSQQFQNDLHHALSLLNPEETIWVEGESLKIGIVSMPDAFWQRMKKARVIEIKVARQERVKRLIKEYGIFPKEELTNSILKISTVFGKQNTDNAIEFLDNDQLTKTADLLLKYYDQTYEYTRKRFRERSLFTFQSESGDATENSSNILHQLESHKMQSQEVLTSKLGSGITGS